MAENEGNNSESDDDVVGHEQMQAANPYQAPNADKVIQSISSGKRLYAFDWLVAALFGILAAILVFPTTCVGAIILLDKMPGAILPISSLAAIVATFCTWWLVLSDRSKHSSYEELE